MRKTIIILVIIFLGAISTSAWAMDQYSINKIYPCSILWQTELMKDLQVEIEELKNEVEELKNMSVRGSGVIRDFHAWSDNNPYFLGVDGRVWSYAGDPGSGYWYENTQYSPPIQFQGQITKYTRNTFLDTNGDIWRYANPGEFINIGKPPIEK